MTSGRQFVRAVAGTAAGCARSAGRHRSGAGARATARRQVSIGGTPVRVIDVHAHCVIPEGGRGGQGHALRRRGRGRRQQHPGTGTPGQTMDAQGVDMQALTINTYWWYGADRDLARAIVRTQNEGLASGWPRTRIASSR